MVYYRCTCSSRSKGKPWCPFTMFDENLEFFIDYVISSCYWHHHYIFEKKVVLIKFQWYIYTCCHFFFVVFFVNEIVESGYVQTLHNYNSTKLTFVTGLSDFWLKVGEIGSICGQSAPLWAQISHTHLKTADK